MTKSLLPPEIVESIIDLAEDTETLKECSLVSKSWVPRAQKHLFNEIKFGSPSKLEAWKKTFPNPANSPAHHTNFLIVGCTEVPTAEDAEEGGWIRSFTNVTRLEVWNSPSRSKPGLNAFHNLSSVVKSLRVVSFTLPSSEVFDLVVCSFPLLEDLRIMSHDDEDVADFQSSTSPVLTGTLVLQERLKCITHQLLNLPNGLHFREIVWKTCVLEELERVTELVERCSDTLECIDVSCQMSSESDIRCLYPHLSPTTSIDLSKATKLKEVAFRFNRLYVIWVTESLKTITSEHKDFQRILIYIPFCLDKTFRWAFRTAAYQQWKGLDDILVKLWETRAARTKVVYNAKEGRRQDMCKFIEGLLPEIGRRKGIELVYSTSA